MIEAHDEGIHRLVGEGEVSHSSIEADGLGVPNTPHAGGVSGIAGSLDSGPGVRVQGGVEKVHSDGARSWRRVRYGSCRRPHSR